MFTAHELSQQIAAYRDGRISRDSFEDWFRTNSRGAYRANPSLSEAAASVEAAFSQYRFQGMDEQSLLNELANAIRPFRISVLKIDPSNSWAWTNSASMASVGAARA